MLVLNAARELIAYSGNWRDVGAARSALDRLGIIDLHALAADQPPVAAARVDIQGEPMDVLAHRSGDGFILELEPAEADGRALPPIYSLARDFLPMLQRADSIEALAKLAAKETKRLTGFGRCLVYRFDRDGHGEVLAEQCDEGYESYEGHRFPAADIPAQARELYRINHIRLIPDARYTPAALVGVRPGFDPRGIDLCWASTRSVSPVHLEYMVNMGTLASMSVSIIVRGKLWGLISCHNHGPRPLPFSVRAACEHLGQLLSLQVEAKEDNASVATRLELRKLILEIVANLADSDATLARLTAEPAALLRMGQASGAAIVLNDRCWTVGETPSLSAVHALAKWVLASGQTVFHSERVPDEFMGDAPRDALPAGMLAISISQVHSHLVMWFRPEQIRTIRWAGDPRKQIRSSDGRVHPRQSFASWREQVRGSSAPWGEGEVAAAAELRQALLVIVLQRAQEMAEVATELGRVNRELEAFSYTVSHDLRAPMRHIAGYVDLVLDTEREQLSERSQRYLGHVKEASAYAGQLVDALLDFSRMGRTELKRGSVDTTVMVNDLVGHFRRAEGAQGVEWDVEEPLPRLHADPFLLQVAVRNLLDNAVKYTRGREPQQVRIRGVHSPEGDGLEVSDNGVGFHMKYASKLFGVFQRLHRAEEFEGTGIGLASVKRIVERHGGTVRAVGEPGSGATFSFVLPRATPSADQHKTDKEAR